jgi:hypothetical protein
VVSGEFSLSFSLSHCHSLSLFLSLSLSLSLSLFLFLSVCLSLSVSLSHSLTKTHIDTLTGTRDEAQLDHLMDEHYNDVEGGRRQRRALRGLNNDNGSKHNDRRHLNGASLPGFSLALFNTTLSHISRCIPLILEMPETYTAASLAAPLLGSTGAFRAELKSNINSRHAVCPPLEGTHRDTIRRAAALEMMLYSAVFNITREHLQQLQSWNFLHQCVYHVPPRQSDETSRASDVVPLVIVPSSIDQRTQLSKMLTTLLNSEPGTIDTRSLHSFA